MSAPARDTPKLRRYAAITRGFDTAAANWAQLTVAVFCASAESGSRTISERYKRVKPIASPNPGRTDRRRTVPITPGLCAPLSPARLVDLVEDAAIGKVPGLRLGPSAEYFVDGEQCHLGELLAVLGGNFRHPGPEVVSGGDLLRLLAVEKLEIGLGDCAGPALVDRLVHQGDRRLGEDADGGQDDLQLVPPELLHRQKGLVLPRDQHVADPTLGEGHGGAPGSRVQHR